MWRTDATIKGLGFATASDNPAVLIEASGEHVSRQEGWLAKNQNCLGGAPMYLCFLTLCILSQCEPLLAEQAREPLLRVPVFRREPIQLITFLSGDDTIALHQRRGPVHLLEIGSANSTHPLPVDGTHASFIALSASGKMCAFCRDRQIAVWDLVGRSLHKTVAVPDVRDFRVLALSADEQFVAIVVDATLPVHCQAEDESIEAATSFRIDVLCIASGSTVASLGCSTRPFTSMAFSHDGRMLAAGTAADFGKPPLVLVWDVLKGIRMATLEGQTEMCGSVQFSPDDSVLATACGLKGPGAIRLWCTATWKCERVLSGHYQGVSCLAFSPNGKLVASGGNELILWDVASGQNVTQPGPAVVLRDAANRGSRIAHEAVGLSTQSVAFSRNGKTLVVGGANGDVTLWDVGTLVRSTSRMLNQEQGSKLPRP